MHVPFQELPVRSRTEKVVQLGKFAKVNLGCGNDYREGWLNIDFNDSVRADVYCDFCDGLPIADDSCDYVLLDNVLEHVKRENYSQFLNDLHRVCVSGATVDIFVPHASGMYALKHPTHYIFLVSEALIPLNRMHHLMGNAIAQPGSGCAKKNYCSFITIW